MMLSEDIVAMIGGYRTERRLGEGGAGAVFLATDAELDRKVAIKILHPHNARDPVRRKRFLREVYVEAEPRATTRVTVPVLWDKARGTIVSNESAEIIRMFDQAFDAVAGETPRLWPEDLREAIETDRFRIHPEKRKNEILGFLNKGLGDLCISRNRERLSWGVPLPFDDRYVCYVWVDALFNYKSAIGYLNDDAREREYAKGWNDALLTVDLEVRRRLDDVLRILQALKREPPKPKPVHVPFDDDDVDERDQEECE